MHRGTLRWVWTFAVLLAFFPRVAGAQAILGSDREREDVALEEAGRSFWSTLAGTSAQRRRAIFGLWALHPYEPQFPEVEWTRGFGFAFSQWFGATFVNSYDERSFIAGIERYWLRGAWWETHFGLGYRVGLVTGYDEKLVSWAEDVPVLPFGGLVGWVDVGPFALDVYYVYRAITLETSVRF